MKITKIELSNFIGLARADIDTSKPITLIIGRNESGKSSLADAISCAIKGTPQRVKHKKDLHQLIHEGAAKGRVTLLDGGEIVGEFKLPGGQHDVADGIVGAEFLDFVLEPSAFARQTLPDRRSTLFALTKCRVKADDTERMLIEAGVDPLFAAEIKPSLRSGFESASKEASGNATQQKGVWKSITGEVWGSTKGETWAPEEVAVQVEQQEIDDALYDAQALELELELEIGEAQTTLGEKRQQVRAAQEMASEIEGITTTNQLLARRSVKLEQDELHLVDMQRKLKTAQEAADGESAKTVLQCPCCSEKLEMVGGSLAKHNIQAKVVTQAERDAVTQYQGYVQSAERAVANSKRDVAQSEAAGERLRQIGEQQAKAVDPEAIENAEKLITDLKQQHAAANAKHQSLLFAKGEADTRQQRIDAASKAHASVMAWLEVAEQLSPDGIPAKILSTAISPVNESLAVLSSMAGWKRVEIGADMEIRCAGRLYGLMSESARWRADTLIALAIAQISELRLIVIDRFDVLDIPGRVQMVGMLKKLADVNAMDTIIACGTMKAKPDLGPLVHCVWVENNVAES